MVNEWMVREYETKWGLNRSSQEWGHRETPTLYPVDKVASTFVPAPTTNGIAKTPSVDL